MGRLGSNMIEILSISEGGPGSPEIVSSVAKFAVTFAHGVATPCSKPGELKATEFQSGRFGSISSLIFARRKNRELLYLSICSSAFGSQPAAY